MIQGPKAEAKVNGMRILVASTLTACAFGVSASAAPSLKGTTTAIVTTDVVLHSHMANGNRITDEALTASLSGTFTGKSKFTLHVVTHADGSKQVQGSGRFTGSVAGCGKVTLRFQTRFRVAVNGKMVGTSGSIGTSPVTYHNTFVGISPSVTETNTYRC
jgi:hypothetical protein